MAFPKPHKTTLPNGLRIIVVPMKENPTVTVQVLVEAGSHYEDKKVNGISHFLEHMFFKGTTKRPGAHIISHEFDSIGADNNAFTGTEYTGYWAKARTKHFERIFDIIADVYLDPLLPEAEIEKEKGVIIEEINMYDDQPTSRVSELLNTTLYGDQPAELADIYDHVLLAHPDGSLIIRTGSRGRPSIARSPISTCPTSSDGCYLAESEITQSAGSHCRCFAGLEKIRFRSFYS